MVKVLLQKDYKKRIGIRINLTYCSGVRYREIAVSAIFVNETN